MSPLGPSFSEDGLHIPRGAPQPGDVIDGLYRIERLHAEGGMGLVYQAVLLNDSRPVAIKVLHASVAQDETIVRRFEREAQAASRIGSPNIVQVLDMGKLPTGAPYLVMEFLEGESLDDRMRGPMPPEELLPIVIQLLEALVEAHHAEIIHRDLKPANVFLVPQAPGSPPLVKVLDFGVSKMRSSGIDNELTALGVVVGTPFYMAPEQAIPEKPVDHRADLFAVGVILYRALSGRLPFPAASFADLIVKLITEQAPPLELVAPGIDRDLAAIVRKAMARDPEQRFGSAGEMAAALRRWQSDRRAAMSPSSGEPAARPRSATPAPAVAAARAAGAAPVAVASLTPVLMGDRILAEPTLTTEVTSLGQRRRTDRVRWTLGIVACLVLLFEIAVLLRRQGIIHW